MSNKIILMYHSIESNDIPAVTGSFPILMSRFKKQILTLKKLGYKFDAISNLNKPISDDKMHLFITGDDGTVDWSRNVLPWCEENSIPTHTGIITGPLEDKPYYPITHVIQIILITRKRENLENLSSNLKKNYLNDAQLEYINKLYHYEEDEYRRIIKGSFNLIITQADAYKLIGEYSKEETMLLQNRFEDIEYYKQFKFAEVAVHTRSHWALGKEKEDYIKNEIEVCKNFLIEKKLSPSKYFVSPMKPKYGATLEDIEMDLKNLGYKGILDSNHGVWDKKSFIIPRIDAKNIETFFKF